MRDELVPVRKQPQNENYLGETYNSTNLKREFLKKITNDSDCVIGKTGGLCQEEKKRLGKSGKFALLVYRSV